MNNLKKKYITLGFYALFGGIAMVTGAFFAFGWAVALMVFGIHLMIVWSGND